jgi:hypothetical protein
MTFFSNGPIIEYYSISENEYKVFRKKEDLRKEEYLSYRK